MDVQLSQDLEAKINRVAAENFSDAESYVSQLVENYVDHDAWFRGRVRKGLDKLDCGEYISHEEMGERIVQMFRSQMEIR
jgi:predicted transcriptional regulator